MGVDTNWNKLPCPFQAYNPTERCRQKTELAFLPKVAQRHGELLSGSPESLLLKAGLWHMLERAVHPISVPTLKMRPLSFANRIRGKHRLRVTLPSLIHTFMLSAL